MSQVIEKKCVKSIPIIFFFFLVASNFIFALKRMHINFRATMSKITDLIKNIHSHTDFYIRVDSYAEYNCMH